MNPTHPLRRGARSAAALALVALLAACAGRPPQTAALSPRPPGAGADYYRVGAPYEVNGVWYYPKVDYHYDRIGIASWYGPGYNGRLTANGEIFDMNGLSAAHPTLPLPSIVRVTDLQNGRSLDLRVNDRGPFVDGRIIDLSRRAAQLLGFETQGTAPVRVKILKRRSIEVAELARQGIIAGGVMVAQSSPAAAAPPVRVASAAPTAPAPQLPPLQPAPVKIAAANPPPAYEPQPIRSPVHLVSYRLPARPRFHPVSYRLPVRPRFRPVSDRLPGRPRFHPVAYRLPVPHPVHPPAYRSTHRIFVQAGAFSVPRNAWRVRARVAGLASVRISAAAIRGVELYRVQLGPFASVEEAHRVLSRVIHSGYPGARLVFD
jgi:rare lipoprotein A